MSFAIAAQNCLKNNIQVPTTDFVELYDKHTAEGFYVINEEPELINEILGNKKFNRIGSIASGGEVLLFSLAHRATELLVGIDHSYRSLSITAAKISLLAELGPSATRNLFIKLGEQNYDLTNEKIKNALLRGFPKLYQQMQKHCYAFNIQYSTQDLSKEWHFGNLALMRRTTKNLSKIKLVHGDLLDASREYGLFDLLYTSNAHEHQTRNSERPPLASFLQMVPIGGLLLYTANTPTSVSKDHAIELAHCRGYRTSWHYYLVQRVA